MHITNSNEAKGEKKKFKTLNPDSDGNCLQKILRWKKALNCFLLVNHFKPFFFVLLQETTKSLPERKQRQHLPKTMPQTSPSKLNHRIANRQNQAHPNHLLLTAVPTQIFRRQKCGAAKSDRSKATSTQTHCHPYRQLKSCPR